MIHLSQSDTMEFTSPFTLQGIGPSGSGKSYWVKRLLDENMIKPKPDNIVYLYGEYQPLFDQMSGVTFHENVPKGIYESFDRKLNNLLVLDDLMECKAAEDIILKIFTMGSHHRNISCIVLGHNIFPKNPKFRTISLNTNFLVLFKNARDRMQIHRLGSQMMIRQTLSEAYNDAVNLSKYGYLVLDLRNSCDENQRLKTNVFPSDKYTIVYQPK